ncbi:MAG: DUF5357 domain-containing protein [Methylacidiphilales bacterium]|nr:DUF5357 domain-containing protein [Candidatus Methylacidiphilales bacterium]NJR16747.1 DUF5357 domain-containing protein [Calothrix sp. CSU_2_0]
MQIVRDLFGLFGIIEFVYERVRRIFIPPSAYSWQTLIYLSLFSWIMSSLSEPPIKNIIAFFGWFFLIAGTSWYTTDQPLLVPGTNMPIGAVITGFLISVFAFGHEQDVLTTRTIVLWPSISAMLTAIPEFFEGSGIDVKRQLPKAEIRQRIIVLVACSLILSCWLQLYFTIDRWVKQYPSIQADDISRSTFVVRTEARKKLPENGVLILNRLQPRVQEQLDNRLWVEETERWLIEAPLRKDAAGNVRGRVNALGQEVIQNLDKQSGKKVDNGQQPQRIEEWQLWNVDARVYNKKGGGYQLDLLSIWNGPSSSSKGYFLRKSCQIDPVSIAADAGTVNIKKPGEKILVAEVQCDPMPKFFAGSPPANQQ